ncbi:terminase large subunit [Bradyrhizobium sp. SEMIA]|uniref:terminase large subunit n=1 Tax=Bradyrhizobium sp. SEMIA TaxID=2597515 RepID=UPI0018A62154|nr:terminase TerL endonuclease subunit [Bradyrhizobium sp. SEMIA]QOG20445.1 terminase large subunit [Bradyrhizobium sp. SEMIA]
MTAQLEAVRPEKPAALKSFPKAEWNPDFRFWVHPKKDGQGNVAVAGFWIVGAWCEGEFWYHERAADKAASFFPNHLVFTEGEWAGRPFVLEPWQEHDIIRPLFGWKRADGTRRFRRCFVWIARKNGKTELAAGVALLILVGDAEMGGQVFSIASEEAQAKIVFTKASNMAVRTPVLAQKLECLGKVIYCPELNGSFRPLSGKPKGKHGLNMSGLVGDEIHEWPSGDLYTFVHDSSAARRQPLEFLISTAGQKGTHGEEVFRECQAIQSGDVEDPETMVVIYSPSEDDDWTKEETWRKGNPNFGNSVKLEPFMADFRRARQLPRLENDFKRYRLNIWTDQAVKWLPINSVDDEGRRFGWDHCIGPVAWNAPEFVERLKGKTCYGGLDLSSTTDLSALAWWFPAQAGLDVPVVLPRFWKPADLVREHSRRDRVPYDRLIKERALFETPGNVVDYGFIEKQVLDDAQQFRVAHYGNDNREAHEGGLAIDRFNATGTAVRLQQEGIPVVLYGQGMVSLSAPSKELERLVMSNGFHHGGHPLLRRHAQVVSIVQDAAENIKPVKSQKTGRIDGIAAFVNALGIAGKGETQTGESGWNTDDLDALMAKIDAAAEGLALEGDEDSGKQVVHGIGKPA